MVDSFSYTGKDFEAFLFTAVRYQIKTVHSQNRRERNRQESFQIYQAEQENSEMSLADNEQLNQFSGCRDDGPRDQLSNCSKFAKLPGESRRLAIVALKNCAVLTDELCLTLANKLGMDLTWLMDCRDELCELSRPRMDIYRILRERERAAAFAVRCIAADEAEAIRRRERLQMIRAQIGRMNPYPRHQDIAKVLGIPKGTVDSSLYYVRRILALACKKAEQAS